MKAVVTKSFDGAQDGEVYPRHFQVGDRLLGDMARVAIAEGWARAETAAADAAPVEAPRKRKGK